MRSNSELVGLPDSERSAELVTGLDRRLWQGSDAALRSEIGSFSAQKESSGRLPGGGKEPCRRSTKCTGQPPGGEQGLLTRAKQSEMRT
jgi:hypothetical protein